MKKYSYIDSPELNAVFTASKLSTFLISSLYVIAYNIIFLFYTPNYTPIHLVAVTSALLFILLAVAFYKEVFSSLLALTGLAITALAIGFFGPNSDVQATASTAIFLCVQLAVITLPKKWIPVWIFVNGLILIILVFKIGIPTEFFGNEYPVRLFSVVQLVVVSIWFYKSWFPQLELVKARDILNQRMAESRESAIALQERTRTWRELLIHTHETVLNDIRSVLDSKSIDFKELKKQINARKKVVVPPVGTEMNFSDLMVHVQEAISAEIDLNIQGARTEVPTNVYAALRAVIVEVCRNFERHASATKITAKASLLYGVLRIELFHNGKDSTNNFESGIGRGVVIKETLDEINGKIFRRINGVELSIALGMRQPTTRSLSATDVGRIAISALAIGNAVGGFLYPLSLLFNDSLYEIVAGICTLALTTFGAFVTLKKIPLGRGYLLLAGAISLIQVVAVNMAIASATSLDVLAISTVLTGFALIAISTWAEEFKWWVVGIPWFMGIIAFRLHIVPEESGTTMASLNTGYGLPFFAAVAIFAIIRSTKRLNETKDLSELELRENAAAIAVADLAKELDEAINAATKTLALISKEENLSNANKNLLKRQDSLIRAIIQVDPKMSGGFSKAALELVKHAVANNVFLKVLAIRDQGNSTIISEDLVKELKRIIETIRDSKSTIQVLANPETSILIIKISEVSAKRALISKLNKFSTQELKVTVEKSPDERIIFIKQEK